MLFHFSKNPNIKEFIPQAADGMPPMFWEIDEEHAANYFFPRDCPRVIYSRSDNISLEDELHPIALFGCNPHKIFTKNESNSSYWMHISRDFFQKCIQCLLLDALLSRILSKMNPIALIGFITLGIFFESASNASYWMHSTQDFYQK